MVDTAPSGPAYREHSVWLALRTYSIGPDNAAFGFADRLAHENGWSALYAARVLDEYRRFAFLAATTAGPVTPSDAVDQAWHLHLTYSRDYWERFCPQVLRRPLHHEPTRGGAAELHRFHAQYADTLKRYAQTFGEDPPEDIWPDAARRLLDDPRARRVHPREGMVITRGRLALLLAIFSLSTAILTWAVMRGS